MGFLNDFINSSGIIFEFHYNFIIFFCVWVPRFYTKNFNFFFTPYTPQKMTILAKFGHFGTFWYFLGGGQNCPKKIMLFKYSPLATQNSKNFYTHCFLIISQIILTGPGLSYQRVLQISCIYCLGQNSKN